MPAPSSSFWDKGQNRIDIAEDPKHPTSLPVSIDPYMRALHDRREPVEVGPLANTLQMHMLSLPSAAGCQSMLSSMDASSSVWLAASSCLLPLSFSSLRHKFMKCMNLKRMA